MKKMMCALSFVMLFGSLTQAGEHSFRKIWNITNGRAFTATTRELLYKAQHKKKKKELLALVQEAKLVVGSLDDKQSVVLSGTLQTLVNELRNSSAAKDLTKLSDAETAATVYTALALMGADGEDARIEAQNLINSQINSELKN